MHLADLPPFNRSWLIAQLRRVRRLAIQAKDDRRRHTLEDAILLQTAMQRGGKPGRN